MITSKNKVTLIDGTASFSIVILYADTPSTDPTVTIQLPWCEVTSVSKQSNVYTYYMKATAESTEYNTITFKDGTESYICYVKQAQIPLPIWKRNVSNYGISADINYDLYIKEGFVSANRANVKPGNTFPRIDNNNLVENLISIDFSTNVEEKQFKLNGVQLCCTLGLNSRPILFDTFIYDWSFDENAGRLRNAYFNNTFAVGQPIYICYNDNSATKYQLRYAYQSGGSGGTRPSLYGYSNIICFRDDIPSTAAKVSIKVSDADAFTFDKKVCAEWCAVYLNMYGGIDSFPIDANMYITKSHTKSLYATYDDTEDYDYETKQYSDVVNSKYSFSTGWLTDEQSIKFADNFMGSTKIWLYNIKDKKYIPCYIESQDVQYKKFSNGRNLVRYDVSLQGSTTNTIR